MEQQQANPPSAEQKPAPDAPCPCNSGKLYEECCGAPKQEAPAIPAQ